MKNSEEKNNNNEEDKKLDDRGNKNDENNNNEEDDRKDENENKEIEEKKEADGGSDIRYNFSFLNNNNGENSNSFINLLADSPNNVSNEKDKKTSIDNGANIMNNMGNYNFDEFSFSEDHGGSGDSKNKKISKLGK